MRLLLILAFCSILLAICFSQGFQSKPDRAIVLNKYKKADSFYRAAENIVNSSTYTEKKEDELNKDALLAFKTLIPFLQPKDPFCDSLAFYSYFKMGVINHFFEDFSIAKENYQNAIDLKQRLSGIADSFLFKVWLYKGLIYYNQDLIDSASFCYRNAEKISDSYHVSLDQSERLYNNLGILYHETGNFTQAKNYFEKAEEVLPKSSPYYKQLLVTYKNNLASSLIRLEQYEKAGEIYQSILPFNQNKNEILYNLATIKLNTGSFQQAINFFKQTNYDIGKRVRVYAYIGLACYNMGKIDSAKIYFDKAEEDNTIVNKTRRNIPHGLALKFKGDMLASEKKFAEALLVYQEAIKQFYPDFNISSILSNPVQFSGVFSYINLFNTITAKADAFELLYKQQKDVNQLTASLDAYRSAFKLADYVERTYTSDEARLFLNKIKYTTHSKPIDVCLALFELTRKREYLEEAYLFDQRNKASILSLNIQENEFKNKESDNKLFQQESSLKAAITRLSLKAALTTDSSQLQSIGASARDLEIQLVKTEEQINANPAYHDKQFTNRIPGLNELQKTFDNKTALLSYHLSDKEFVILLITRNKIDYIRSPVDSSFYNRVDLLKKLLHNVGGNEPYEGKMVAHELYEILIGPLEKKLSNSERLIIIPDDELNYLPFEALQDKNNKYLIERFTVQYQYTTALLAKALGTVKASGILAFAPFASKGFHDSTGASFNALPASKEEIATLKGMIFIDKEADKNTFLQTANHYGIIHLATHASVNNDEPARSFIAFFPGNSNYKLYAQEIYNLNLDSTQLIILSACETGTGQLIKGEGLMSLSRAFAYAGCPNIITSLWKAEDKTTAFITQKLHYYLEKGYSKDKALQRAKLDLLNSTGIDPRFKTPNYWAHLVFIGNYEPKDSSSTWWFITIGIIIATIVYIYVKRKA